jgi:hypothetical protein
VKRFQQIAEELKALDEENATKLKEFGVHPFTPLIPERDCTMDKHVAEALI